MTAQHRDGQSGAAVVEMAFVTILLFILVAGIVDAGRAIYTNIGLQDAAEEGVMYAAYNWPVDESTLATRVQESTNYPDLEAAGISLSCTHGSDATDPLDDTVTVSITHQVNLITPLVGQFLGGTLDLTQEFTGEIFTGEPCP